MDYSNEMTLGRDEWYSKCSEFGYDYALNVLTYYVQNNQPATFLPSCTGSRSMAKIAAFGIEGIPIESDIALTDAKHGFDLYMKMFGNHDYDQG